MTTAVATKPTNHSALPTTIGAPCAGRFFLGADAYALIVSPRAEGDLDPLPWNKSLKKVAGALSYCDGLANTDAMVKAGSTLSETIRALSIGGFDDWYLPSRLESLILFGELRDVEAFAEKGDQAINLDWYWTSTQSASDAAYAWIQGFYYGYQDFSHESNFYRARAVRRIKL